MKRLAFVVCVAAIAAACTEELSENQPVTDGSVQTEEPVYYVTANSVSSADTKTFFEQKTEGGYKVLWAEDDLVSVNGLTSVSTEISDDKVSARFGFASEPAEPLDMVYPAYVVKSYADRVATLTLPSGQNYADGSFDPASGLVFGSGTAEGGVALDHAMAYMKVVPTIASDHDGHDIASFSITTAGEAVSGTFSLDFAEGKLTAVEGETGVEVTVSCGKSGVASGNGIILAIPAQTYAAGMQMTITDTRGCTYTATSLRELDAVAGTVYKTELTFDPLLIKDYYYDFGTAENVESPEVSSTNAAITVVYADGTEFPVSNGSFRSGNTFTYVVVSGEGEYITFPALEGKRLTTVRILTSGSTRSFAIAADTNGTLVAGGDKFEFTDEENDNTWNLEGTLLNTPYYGMVPSDGNKTTMTIRKLWLTYEEEEKALVAEACEQRSSTLSFKWMYNDGTSPANVAYTVNLYDASDNLVRSHTYPTTGDIVRKFVFAGLDQNTTYKFEVVDPDGIRSEKVSATTKPFTVVTIPEQPLAPSATNVTILAEDMSQLCYEGDKVHSAAGYRPTTLSLHSPDYSAGSVVSYDIGHGLFTNLTYKTDEHLNQTRFTGWAWESNASLIVNAGYFKLGSGTKYSNMFTPVLACIPQGYSAKLKVTVTLARYNHTSEKDAVAISLVKGGTVATNKALTGYETIEACPLTIDTGFKDYEFEIDGATCDSRIMVGPDLESDSSVGNRRIMFAGIKIEVLSLDLAGVKDIELTEVYYSEATINWEEIEGVDSYNVYVDEVKVNKEPLTEPTFHVAGLENNTTYNLTVGTVVGGKEVKSEPVEFKTKNVWIVNKGRTNVCVQWDDISTGTAADGMDKGYMIEVLKADRTTSVFGEMFCGQNAMSSASSAFSSTDRLGKTDGVNHFPQMRVGIGLLDPATTYYVRVRSLDEFTSTITSTLNLTNSAGNSEWSSLVEFTTDPAHVAGAKEVIWTGFDECGVLPDYKNMCAGLAPMLTSGRPAAVFAADKSQYQWGFYPFQSVGHQTNTMGYGSTGNYVDGQANHRGVKNVVLNRGTMTGWCVPEAVKPGIGVLLLNNTTTSQLYLGTPALSANLQDEVEVKCKVTVVAGFYPYGSGQVTKSPYFEPFKWNGTEHVAVDASTVYYVGGTPTSSYVDANNYTTEIHTQTDVFYVNLKKGDNVKFHVNNTNVFFDEILIEVAE